MFEVGFLRSVPARLISPKGMAIMYSWSVLFQLYWWSYMLYYNADRLSNTIMAMFSAWIPAKALAVFICVCLGLFALVTIQSIRIAWKLWKLTVDKAANAFQTDEQAWRSVKAIACIVVTIVVAIIIPTMSDPEGWRAWFAGHLSAAILFGYNLFATEIYHRK
jgi:hypothetical protein